MNTRTRPDRLRLTPYTVTVTVELHLLTGTPDAVTGPGNQGGPCAANVTVTATVFGNVII